MDCKKRRESEEKVHAFEKCLAGIAGCRTAIGYDGDVLPRSDVSRIRQKITGSPSSRIPASPSGRRRAGICARSFRLRAQYDLWRLGQKSICKNILGG